MKAYLKVKKKQKQNDLRIARNLFSKIGNAVGRSEKTDSTVRTVKTSIGSCMKSDNASELINRVDSINNGCTNKINSSYTLASRLISKIENEIDEIDRKLRQIAREEEEERRRKAKEEWEKNHSGIES